MAKRVFRVLIEYDNSRWQSADLANYIEKEIRAGEGMMAPAERPDIFKVEVTYKGQGIK